MNKVETKKAMFDQYAQDILGRIFDEDLTIEIEMIINDVGLEQWESVVDEFLDCLKSHGVNVCPCYFVAREVDNDFRLYCYLPSYFNQVSEFVKCWTCYREAVSGGYLRDWITVVIRAFSKETIDELNAYLNENFGKDLCEIPIFYVSSYIWKMLDAVGCDGFGENSDVVKRDEINTCDKFLSVPTVPVGVLMEDIPF